MRRDSLTRIVSRATRRFGRFDRAEVSADVHRHIRRVVEGWGVRTLPPLPPESIRFMNESDERFVSTGDELLADLREHASLAPQSTVLDLGCGYGRFAHALSRWPPFQGRYLGVDILPKHVGWCRANLHRRSKPRFDFHVLDVHNARYNPKGVVAPEDMHLPEAPTTFDVVLLASVFTHMYEEHIIPYLREVRRVLVPGGRVLVSFFLLNDASSVGEAAGRSAYPMVNERNDHCRYMNPDDPLNAIGYDERWLLGAIETTGLTLAKPVLYGAWCGRENGYRFQDFLVLERRV